MLALNNDKDLLVSIIIPVHNVKPYISEALESVIHQTYANLEIIIIDDGSTDGSGRVCDEYAKKDKRMRVIHQQNKGLSAARNVGLEIASGKVIAFLDSDDAYHPVFVEKMLYCMYQEKADVVVCKYTCHDTVENLIQIGTENIVPQIQSGIYNRKAALDSLLDNSLNQVVWNKLYRYELWENIRFPEGHVYEDIETTFRVLNICNVVYVLDLPLYMYRKRSDSITRTISLGNEFDKVRAFFHLLLFVEKHTPELFTDAQLNGVKKSLLSRMISDYCQYYSTSDEERRVFCEFLMDKINLIGNSIEMSCCNLRIRSSYMMIQHYPILLRAIYPFYHIPGLIVKSLNAARILKKSE